MNDKEKVIKELERVVNAIVDGYIYEPDRAVNAIADAIALLKEQEAIPPGKESDGNPGKWASWWYVCGACGKEIDYRDRFCRYCGQEVKWE